METIPSKQDYEEYCSECENLYIPHWTYCKCPRADRKHDIHKAIQEVEKRQNLCNRDQYHVCNDSVEIYCPEKEKVKKPKEKLTPLKPLERPTKVDRILDEIYSMWNE